MYHMDPFCNRLKKAKAVLEKNQYPPGFYEEVIADTLRKIVDPSDVDIKQRATEDRVEGTKFKVMLRFK